MPKRINRAIELLDQDQPIYYMGPHSGHVLTYEQGLEDSQTWADYINVGMEHGFFDSFINFCWNSSRWDRDFIWCNVWGVYNWNTCSTHCWLTIHGWSY